MLCAVFENEISTAVNCGATAVQQFLKLRYEQRYFSSKSCFFAVIYLDLTFYSENLLYLFCQNDAWIGHWGQITIEKRKYQHFFVIWAKK